MLLVVVGVFEEIRSSVFGTEIFRPYREMPCARISRFEGCSCFR